MSRPTIRSAGACFALLLTLVAAPACTPRGHVGGTSPDLPPPDAAMPPPVPDDMAVPNLPGERDLALPDLSLPPPPPDLGSADGGVVVPACATLPGTPVGISGHIVSNRTLTCDHLYLFSGLVIVDTGATLTVEKGTTILMSTDGSLIVRPGAKLRAQGTRDQPIVFTSAHLPGTRAPGDWGMVALLGKSPGNWGTDSNGKVITQHAPEANDWPGGTFPYVAGGSDPADSSGTLKYVRFEYGGMVRTSAGQTDHEMVGMYGVGRGTLLEYIDMRQSNFGCLFAEGGTFDARHLVCQWGENGGFDFTRGNQSRVQFLLNQESPFKAAEGLGLKGPGDKNQLQPLTDPAIYNVTLCGTNGANATLKDPYGIFLKRQPAGHLHNLIASGYHAGIAMLTGGPAPGGGVAPATTELRDSILFGNFDPSTPSTNIAYPSPPNDTDLVAWFYNQPWENSVADPQLGDCFDPSTLKAAPASAITTHAAKPPNDGFFDPSATYVGAFKDASDTWASGAWVVWSTK